MNRKRLIIIMSVILILLIIALIVFLLFFRPTTPEVVSQPTNEVNSNTNITRQIEGLPEPSPERVEDEENYPLGLKQLAMSFSERFASYSTDANFKNLNDLRTLSTSKMEQFINDYIATAGVSDGFEAVEAKAINSQLIDFTEGSATLVMSLQLNKFEGDKADFETTYEKIELKCVREGDEWRVDEIKWL